ncbi:hypothetical protein OEA41_002692 [Lepraria neglecta]|uniref:Major facilitator superfamily (MFS) profile domain-containing protein n=1 Tax=Lepraria neglecta TaxID=209136 RepID=A0AAD9Z3A0_9LECA|nr:hypothetical protein OEA41_002692 [Lepraria neglecta]
MADAARRDSAMEKAADDGSPTRNSDNNEEQKVREDGKIELTEEDCYQKLGFSYPTWKKWMILSVIFAVQVSMNFNTSIYSNAVAPLTVAFKISGQAARVGQCVYLVTYAFGCELWAPWSEDLGRWPILQLSLFLVNIWQIPCALAPNYSTIIAFRFLGGLSSAGGSVTLGMVADMWEADNQQYAVAFIVLSSVGGSAVGPLVGAFVERWLSWHWNFWVQLIFGGVVQVAHFVLVPETRATIIVDREAKKRRKAGETNIYGPNELKENRFQFKKILVIWARPFEMFIREPIVLCLSLLSGFSDALIFTFLESYQPVYEQWGFGTTALGLAFIPIIIGYFLSYFSFFPFIHRHRQIRRKDPDALQPEARLYWLLYLAPLEFIGLIGFAWTTLGPAYHVHWIAPMIFSMLVGIANYAIYMATVDYMIASYGPYSASATGGNGFSRDFLAGIAAMYSTPFYTDVGNGHAKYKLEWPTTVLAGLAILVTIPIYIFYWKGPIVREKSKFAQTLASDRKRGGRGDSVGVKAEAGHMEDDP